MNVVSFGGGTNSAAMIIGMYTENIPIDLILFADTGNERPHTYRFVAEFNRWLAERGLPSITVVRYTKKNGEVQTLEQECLRLYNLPSPAYGPKKCSEKYKIRPQEKYLRSHPRCNAIWDAGRKVTKYIGYDAGEPQRIAHAKAIDEADTKYQKVYFLFERGWDREKCRDVIAKEGLPHPGKSSCFFCPNMKKAEIEELYTEYPALFAHAVAIEDNAKTTKIKGLGREWRWKDYIDAWLEAKECQAMQIKLGGFEDLPGTCMCSMPCGCYDG